MRDCDAREIDGSMEQDTFSCSGTRLGEGISDVGRSVRV